MKGLSATFAAVCLVASLNAPLATTLGENPELDALYRDARSTLDSASNQTEFTHAAKILYQILERDEEYAPAYVELARLTLKTSYTFSSGPTDYFTEAGLAQAQSLLDLALSLEPSFADTLVLYGYVATSMDRPMLALINLEAAENLGSDSLWLHLNRAHVYEVIGNRQAARDSYLAVNAIATEGSSQHISALESLTRVAEAADEIDFYYVELIRMLPRYAGYRADYADFLRREGHFDEAIQFGRGAIELGGSGLSRPILAVALYAKAGQLAASGADPSEVAALIAEGELLGYEPSKAVIDLASFATNRPAVIALADYGIDIDVPNELGDTGVFIYINEKASAADLAALLARGVNVNHRNRTGLSPLHTAVRDGAPAIVALLLDAGANPNAPRYDDLLPLEIALERGDTTIIELLERAGAQRGEAPSTGIIAGVKSGDPAQIDRAIKYLHFENPLDLEVVAALQDAVASDPLRTLQLAQELGGVLRQMCRHPGSASAATIEERLAAVNTAIAQGPQNAPSERGLSSCQSMLIRAQGESADLPLPARPTPEERAQLLVAADEALRVTRGNDMSFRRADDIARRLTITDPKDVAARVLAAQTALLAAENMATGMPETLYLPERLQLVVDQLESALRSDNATVDALALYGHVLLHEGHVDLGRVVLDRAITLPNDSFELRLYELESTTAQGDFEYAEPRLRDIVMSSDDPRVKRKALQFLIAGYAAQGDAGGAQVAYDEWISIDPQDGRPVVAYTQHLLYELANFSKAVEVGRKLSEIGRHVNDNHLFAQALLADGATRLSLGEITEAADLFRRALRVQPDPGLAIIQAGLHPSTSVTLLGLYSAGLSIDVPDNDGNTPLFSAVQRNDLDAIDALLSLGSDVNARNGLGYTPLGVALLFGYEDAALKLLAAGSDDSYQLPDGSYVSDIAYSMGLARLLERLEEFSEQRYPDWETFLDGVRAAQPVHVTRALTLSSQAAVDAALHAAIVSWPRTVVRVAAETGRLEDLCSERVTPDAGDRSRLIGERMTAIDVARTVQQQLGIVPVDDALETCHALLAGQAPVVASR